MVQHLTLEKAKSAARAAYGAKKLTAQHPKPESRKCFYEYGDYHCAIGAGLTKATLKEVRAKNVNSGNGVQRLVDLGVITVDESEHEDLCELQRDHDAFAESFGESRDWARNRFKRAIGL